MHRLWKVVYDAGALLAAERNDRAFHADHLTFLRHDRQIVVPSPVLAQAWRGGSRQAALARLLRACVVEPTSEETARNAGVLLDRAGTADAVDAIVVATALAHEALIVTSDPEDIALLWGASGVALKPAIVAV